MKNLSTAGCALVALCLALPAQAMPADKPDLEALRLKVGRLLETQHALPKAKVFKALGPDVVPILLQMAEDEQLFPLYRGRALEALSYYPTEQTWEVFERTLRSRHVMDRFRAVHGFALAFPKRAPERLSRLARGQDQRIARTALRSLKKMKSAEARQALEILREDPKVQPLLNSLRSDEQQSQP